MFFPETQEDKNYPCTQERNVMYPHRNQIHDRTLLCFCECTNNEDSTTIGVSLERVTESGIPLSHCESPRLSRKKIHAMIRNFCLSIGRNIGIFENIIISYSQPKAGDWEHC
jgi:hypothetical protein